MEEEAASSGGMAPALSPTPSAGSRQEVLEAKKPFSGERPEGGQEPLPSNLAASTMGQAGKADEGSLRNGNEDDWMQHRISLYVLRSVHNEPANADTLTSEEQDADREEDMRVRTAVGTNSGPDLLNSTHVTPADATTSTTAPTETKQLFTTRITCRMTLVLRRLPRAQRLVDRDPLESNAAPPLGNDIFDLENITELMSIGLIGDSIVHGCVLGRFRFCLWDSVESWQAHEPKGVDVRSARRIVYRFSRGPSFVLFSIIYIFLMLHYHCLLLVFCWDNHHSSSSLLFNVRLLHTVMSDVLSLFFDFFVTRGADLTAVQSHRPHKRRSGWGQARSHMKCEGCCVDSWNSVPFLKYISLIFVCVGHT
ncbi:hypothetical protein TcYC6_0030110 [Trypanosoma cruzi]|nr:hypothetical protein TcYC6_0030110 [Trypanosoma cruzi]